jgi:hypothetical protein
MCGRDAELIFWMLIGIAAVELIIVAWVGNIHERVCGKQRRQRAER